MFKIITILFLIFSISSCNTSQSKKQDPNWINENTYRITVTVKPKANITDIQKRRARCKEHAIITAQYEILVAFRNYYQLIPDCGCGNSPIRVINPAFRPILKNGTTISFAFNKQKCVLTYEVKNRNLKKFVKEKLYTIKQENK